VDTGLRNLETDEIKVCSSRSTSSLSVAGSEPWWSDKPEAASDASATTDASVSSCW